MSDLGTKVALGQIKPLGGVNFADIITADSSGLSFEKTMTAIMPNALSPEQKKDSYSNSVSEIASGYALGKVIDTNDNIYYADQAHQRIKKVT